jgi:cytidine deaminase
MKELELIKEAFLAQSFSYAPYSKFHVGAALLGKNGKIYQGCNIENAALTPTNCAERTAFFKAISEGVTDFEAIVVVGSLDGTKQEDAEYCAPCGVCRQVMAEFCDPDSFRVILARTEDEYQEYLLKDILPLGFTGKDINK